MASSRRLRQALSDVVVASNQAFFGVSALLFVGSAALTITSSASMSAMAGMPMPGGWTMSMMWMRIPGQTWLGLAASFAGTWMAMTVAMMLPSFIATLWRYRQALRRTGAMRVDRLTGLVAAGYFFAWSACGVAVFLVGLAITTLTMQHASLARVMPTVAGWTFAIGGAFQLTAWKARHLASCREAFDGGHTLPVVAAQAWRQGLCLGVHCNISCSGLTACLLVIGVMDLRAMALVMAAVTAERLAPAGERVARTIGVVLVVAALTHTFV